MTLSRRSLSNREEKPTAMSELSINNVERFLDRKFRASRSYATKDTYRFSDKDEAEIRELLLWQCAGFHLLVP